MNDDAQPTPVVVARPSERCQPGPKPRRLTKRRLRKLDKAKKKRKSKWRQEHLSPLERLIRWGVPSTSLHLYAKWWQLERWLRDLAQLELQARFKREWKAQIARIENRRDLQAPGLRYMPSSDDSNPLGFADFGDLRKLLMSIGISSLMPYHQRHAGPVQSTLRRRCVVALRIAVRRIRTISRASSRHYATLRMVRAPASKHTLRGSGLHLNPTPSLGLSLQAGGSTGAWNMRAISMKRRSGSIARRALGRRSRAQAPCIMRISTAADGRLIRCTFGTILAVRTSCRIWCT